MPGSNMTVHRIRLRGPWHVRTTPQTPPRTVRLPARWGDLVEAGNRHVQLTRRFHRPTNLGPADRVSLVVDDLPEGASVSLNGTSLGPDPPQAAQQTVFAAPQLELNNLLTVEFDVAAFKCADDQTWGDVALVIESR